VEIVHLGEYRRRRGGDGSAARDAELSGLQGDHHDKYDYDCNERQENFYEHGENSPH
jgi:hypothetical protein